MRYHFGTETRSLSLNALEAVADLYTWLEQQPLSGREHARVGAAKADCEAELRRRYTALEAA
jgi:hypothetical protein